METHESTIKYGFNIFQDPFLTLARTLFMNYPLNMNFLILTWKI